MRSELENVKAELDDLKVIVEAEHEHKNALQAKYEKMKAEGEELHSKYQREVAQLRESRQLQMDDVRRKQGMLRENCQQILDKVKLYLRDQKRGEDLRNLYGQEKGVQEIIKLLNEVKKVDISEGIIANIVAKEKGYADDVEAANMAELQESDLILRETVEGTPLEVQASVDAYQSNEGLIDSDQAQALREAAGGEEGAGEQA